MMATEFITTNVIVAVVEIVTRLSPLPPILIDEQMAVATLRYGVKTETNFVGVVENGNVTEPLKSQYGSFCKCDKCSGKWLFAPDNLLYSSVRKLYLEIGCPYCRAIDEAAKKKY